MSARRRSSKKPGRGQELTVNGWIYGLKDGHVRDLDLSLKGEDDLHHLRTKY